jgi:transcriptional regulator with GAF, ATPase, and Fis domain
MQRLLAELGRLAEARATVLVQGESGTGKEVFAHAIHQRSHRSRGPFVRLNCAALSEGVLESELFGHERGAFTGAMRQHAGRFELAHRGTLFLDEIGAASPSVQVRLLRVLQEQEFERLGGTQTLRVDVRVIAATNAELRREVASGRFREDLFYRLDVLPVLLPPLRERREDIPLLVEHFIQAAANKNQRPLGGIEEEALAHLKEYPWPGNIVMVL